MIEPSISSTIEWTTDCGWTTTSIRSAAYAEQPVRLDDLEALVHQRRRVDGDLAAHPPGRVAQRGVDGDVGERLGRQVAERAAGGGEDQPAHLGRSRAPCRHWWMALCSLSTGSTSTPWRRAARSMTRRAGHDQHFLVGERDALAGARWRRRTASSAAVPDEAHSTVSTSSRVTSRSAPRGPAPHRSSAPPRRRQLRPQPSQRGVGGHAPRRAAGSVRPGGPARGAARRRRGRRPAADRGGRRRPRARCGRSSRSSRGSRGASGGPSSQPA